MCGVTVSSVLYQSWCWSLISIPVFEKSMFDIDFEYVDILSEHTFWCSILISNNYICQFWITKLTVADPKLGHGGEGGRFFEKFSLWRRLNHFTLKFTLFSWYWPSFSDGWLLAPPPPWIRHWQLIYHPTPISNMMCLLNIDTIFILSFRINFNPKWFNIRCSLTRTGTLVISLDDL